MGDDRWASFFSLYLAPTHSIAVGRSDSVGVGSADYGSKSGSDSVWGDNGVLWHQGSETRFQSSAETRAEDENGWIGDLLDWLLDGITSQFTKMWDNLRDEFANMTAIFTSQKGLLSEINLRLTDIREDLRIVKADLKAMASITNHVKLLHENFLTYKSVFELRMITVIDTITNWKLTERLTEVNTNIKNATTAVTRVGDYIGTDSGSSGLNYQLRQSLTVLKSTNSYITAINNSLGSEISSTGINYHIRQLVSNVKSSLNYMQLMYSSLGNESSSSGINYHMRQAVNQLKSVSTVLSAVYTNLGTDTSSTGLNYQVRQIMTYVKDSATYLGHIYTNLGSEGSSVGLNYQVRQILSAVKAIKPSTGGFTLDELEKMLKKALKEIDFKINIGDTVNEAGKNIWDVLDSLTDGIFDLGKEIVKATAEIIKVLADLIGDIMKELLKLIVPDNTDFIDKGFEDLSGKFNKKFEVVFKLSGDIKTLFTPIETNAFDSMSFEYMGTKADMNQAKRSLDPYASKFRVLMQIIIWILCVIGCYRKVTGKGDLINDS